MHESSPLSFAIHESTSGDMLTAGLADAFDNDTDSSSSGSSSSSDNEEAEDLDRNSMSSDNTSDVSIDDLITDLGGGLSLMEQFPVLYNDVPVNSNMQGTLAHHTMLPAQVVIQQVTAHASSLQAGCA